MNEPSLLPFLFAYISDFRTFPSLESRDSRLQTPDSRLQTPDSRLQQTPVGLQREDSRLQTTLNFLIKFSNNLRLIDCPSAILNLVPRTFPRLESTRMLSQTFSIQNISIVRRELDTYGRKVLQLDCFKRIALHGVGTSGMQWRLPKPTSSRISQLNKSAYSKSNLLQVLHHVTKYVPLGVIYRCSNNGSTLLRQY